MANKRNRKSKLIGNAIILNDKDRDKRINSLRGSIMVGNDNKKIHEELKELTNQDTNTYNKIPNDLYTDLKNLTPILKTSNATQNVHNRVYNIIDYLRGNKYITREQFHKCIKSI